MADLCKGRPSKLKSTSSVKSRSRNAKPSSSTSPTAMKWNKKNQTNPEKITADHYSKGETNKERHSI